jgi:hypothetical protein
MATYISISILSLIFLLSCYILFLENNFSRNGLYIENNSWFRVMDIRKAYKNRQSKEEKRKILTLELLYYLTHLLGVIFIWYNLARIIP